MGEGVTTWAKGWRSGIKGKEVEHDWCEYASVWREEIGDVEG